MVRYGVMVMPLTMGLMFVMMIVMRRILMLMGEAIGATGKTREFYAALALGGCAKDPSAVVKHQAQGHETAQKTQAWWL